MERVIATHHLEGHCLVVLESIDDDGVTIRLRLDDQMLPPDIHSGRAPTEDEAAALLDSWREISQNKAATQTANVGELQPEEVIALLEALDDEHKAHATYTQVLADFGDVLPFAHIVDAEARHINALTRVMRRYHVPAPPNPWIGKVQRFTSVEEACAASLEAEIDNGALFDRLLATTQRPDIVHVFRRLQEASQQRHLPAFERCVEWGRVRRPL